MFTITCQICGKKYKAKKSNQKLCDNLECKRALTRKYQENKRQKKNESNYHLTEEIIKKYKALLEHSDIKVTSKMADHLIKSGRFSEAFFKGKIKIVDSKKLFKQYYESSKTK